MTHRSPKALLSSYEMMSLRQLAMDKAYACPGDVRKTLLEMGLLAVWEGRVVLTKAGQARIERSAGGFGVFDMTGSRLGF